MGEDRNACLPFDAAVRERANGIPAATAVIDVFAARLRKLSPKIQLVNYGCPGESTVTFVRGHCPAFADAFKLHDVFRG
jgi:hypothetical protein